PGSRWSGRRGRRRLARAGATARNGGQLVVRLEPSKLEHRAVDDDVGLAEVDVAADDGLPAKRPSGADADDPAVAEALALEPGDERVLDRLRVGSARLRRRAAASGQ